jgi:photosystem II stability/assembly factor-like uncharacterized protein
VFKTADGGGHWTAVNTGLSNTNVNVLTSDGAQNVYAGTNGGGVFKTVDGGPQSWTTASNGVDPGVLSLAVDPQAPTTIYAGA